MRKVVFAAAVLLLVPVGVSAQLSIGASAAYAWPEGDAAKGGKMTEIVKSAVPVELTLGYPVTPALELGVYGGWAFGRLSAAQKAECAALGETCSTYGYRAGLRGEYLFGSEGVVPFVAARAGWAWQALEVKNAVATSRLTINGWELGLEGGAEVKVSESLRLGAFASLVFGEFGESRAEIESSFINLDKTTSIPSSQRTVHEWLAVGIRGRFAL